MREDLMNTVRRLHPIAFNLALLISFVVFAPAVFAQAPVSGNGTNASRASGRPVTIPLTIKINSRQLESENELQNIDLTDVLQLVFRFQLPRVDFDRQRNGDRSAGSARRVSSVPANRRLSKHRRSENYKTDQ